ncbi:hypothetical protein [Halobacterium sp. KA-6]|uniref:hypothetical protein n=1 Tax=Halobacterium sp. KA-6 TaxID=2896368 RepID=UPI001E2F3247|nr:hypothetical protein [Halobacterium sp. KA-6]MCD2204381.1 hypothetical protein [Halobacterium sp. KA-6]
MSELADHHYPPNSTSAGVASDVEDFRTQVREYCRYRRHEQGNTYVTATKVTREFDVTPQKAGAALAKLTEAGALSKWKDDARRTTYRITLEESSDQP